MLKNLVKTIEKRVASVNQICDHFPPEVHNLDGSVENEEIHHNCGFPRLQVFVSLKNAVYPRLIEEARASLEESRLKFPDHPESERRRIIADAHGLSEELL